jgi:CheY-like chemotaxis protein
MNNNTPDTTNPKVLLIDDDVVTKNVLKKFLEGKYQLDWAPDGEDALLKAKENDYDVFLVDIGLPLQMNGIQVTEKLKEIISNKDKPYIALTAYAMTSDRDYFLANGLTHYISKPFEKQMILDLLKQVLNT